MNFQIYCQNTSWQCLEDKSHHLAHPSPPLLVPRPTAPSVAALGVILLHRHACGVVAAVAIDGAIVSPRAAKHRALRWDWLRLRTYLMRDPQYLFPFQIPARHRGGASSPRRVVLRRPLLQSQILQAKVAAHRRRCQLLPPRELQV